jgi:bile acid:Na+ symporter, BASS family
MRHDEIQAREPAQISMPEAPMLMDLLSKASTIAMLSFVISSMLAMGVGLSISQIVQPLRSPRLIVVALLSNFVLMPLCAFALSTMLRLDEPLSIGMLLLGCAAGAPFLPKLAELAKGNLPFAVGTMVLLMVVTVGYLPVVLPLLLPGVAVNPAKIAQSLVLLMLLPLGIGLALKSRYEELAARVKPVLDQISNISLILLVLLITAANIDKVLEVFGTRGILAGLLFIALGFAMGWLLGGPGNDTRRVLALGTAQRNIAAALVVGSQSFSDPQVVVMVIVVAIVGLIILMPLSRALTSR